MTAARHSDPLGINIISGFYISYNMQKCNKRSVKFSSVIVSESGVIIRARSVRVRDGSSKSAVSKSFFSVINYSRKLEASLKRKRSKPNSII